MNWENGSAWTTVMLDLIKYHTPTFASCDLLSYEENRNNAINRFCFGPAHYSKLQALHLGGIRRRHLIVMDLLCQTENKRLAPKQTSKQAKVNIEQAHDSENDVTARQRLVLRARGKLSLWAIEFLLWMQSQRTLDMPLPPAPTHHKGMRKGCDFFSNKKKTNWTKI